MSDMSAWDVIVIGGGYGGLSAAALLARKGRKVLLLEKAPLLGGRAQCFEEEGFVWQNGPHGHRLALEGRAAEVFRRLGEKIEFLPRDAQDQILLGGKLYPRPEGWWSLINSEVLSFPARVSFLRFIRWLENEDPEEWWDKSLLECFRSRFRGWEAERFLRLVGQAIMAPELDACSAGEAIDFLHRAFKARREWGQPAGGARQIVRKLEAQLIVHGGEILTGREARAVRLAGGRAAGVETADGFLGAERVVFAGHLTDLPPLLPEGTLDGELKRFIDGLEPTRCLVVDFVTNGPISDLKGAIIGLDAPLYISFPTNVDPAVAPPGKHLSTWLWTLDRGEPEAARQRAEEGIHKTAETLYPGFYRLLEKQRKLFFPVMNGALLKPSQSRPHRPDFVVPGVEGLYLVGDATRGEGSGGDIAFSSACHVADLIAAGG